MSSSIPFRPAASLPENTPFRFLSLPSEIRNKIYGVILTAKPQPPLHSDLPSGLHHVPTDLTKLEHGIDTQILLTCKQIYREGTYILRQTNLFIKVTSTIPVEEFVPLLVSKRIPVINGKSSIMSAFPHHLLRYLVRLRTDELPMKAWTFILLRRDMDLFCGALQHGQWRITHHNDLVLHSATLIDPYACKASSLPPDISPSDALASRKQQEYLIAPYLTALKGFQNFTVDGAIDANLQRTFMACIKRSPDSDPASLISNLTAMKDEGNIYFRAGNSEMASEEWCQAIMKILRVISDLSRLEFGRADSGADSASLSRENGDGNGNGMGKGKGKGKEILKKVEFLTNLASLFFDLSSNRAANALNAMRAASSQKSQTLVRALAETFFHAVGEALGTAERFGGFGCSWEPEGRKLGKVWFREAVACRLVGVGTMLEGAEEAIGRTGKVLTGDEEVERERVRFGGWRRRVG